MLKLVPCREKLSGVYDLGYGKRKAEQQSSRAHADWWCGGEYTVSHFRCKTKKKNGNSQ